MARSATVQPPRRVTRPWRWWLCSLALLLLAAQQWGQVHTLGHVLGQTQGQAAAWTDGVAAAQTAGQGDAPHDEAAQHQGAEWCGLCLMLAAFSASVLPGLLRWRSARLGQASPRGPPQALVRLARCWAAQARGPPLTLC